MLTYTVGLGIYSGPSLHLHPYIVYASNEGSDKFTQSGKNNHNNLAYTKTRFQYSNRPLCSRRIQRREGLGFRTTPRRKSQATTINFLRKSGTDPIEKELDQFFLGGGPYGTL